MNHNVANNDDNDITSNHNHSNSINNQLQNISVRDLPDQMRLSK